MLWLRYCAPDYRYLYPFRLPVVQAAKDHGISEGTIYTWLSRKAEGQPTLSEIVRLKRENAQLLQLVGEMTLKLSETQKKK
jgi:transposase-like protein